MYEDIMIEEMELDDIKTMMVIEKNDRSEIQQKYDELEKKYTELKDMYEFVKQKYIDKSKVLLRVRDVNDIQKEYIERLNSEYLFLENLNFIYKTFMSENIKRKLVECLYKEYEGSGNILTENQILTIGVEFMEEKKLNKKYK